MTSSQRLRLWNLLLHRLSLCGKPYLFTQIGELQAI
jgi:hypothetical protein